MQKLFLWKQENLQGLPLATIIALQTLLSRWSARYFILVSFTINLHPSHSLGSYSTTFGQERYGRRILISLPPYLARSPRNEAYHASNWQQRLALAASLHSSYCSSGHQLSSRHALYMFQRTIRYGSLDTRALSTIRNWRLSTCYVTCFPWRKDWRNCRAVEAVFWWSRTIRIKQRCSFKDLWRDYQSFCSHYDCVIS